MVRAQYTTEMNEISRKKTLVTEVIEKLSSM